MHDKPIALFVTGFPGSGKSTLVRQLGAIAGCPTFHSSSAITKLAKPDDGANLLAPDQYDSVVMSALDFFCRHSQNSPLWAIETFPRKPGQLQMVEDLCETWNRRPIFLLVTAEPEVRHQRIKARSFGTDREEHDLARIAWEKENVPEDHYQQMLSGRQVITLSDASEETVRMFIKHFGFEDLIGDPVEVAFNAAVNGNRERSGYSSKPDPLRMIERTKEELDELLEGLKNKQSEAEIFAEFADVCHFILCLADGLGMTPETIKSAFLAKTFINQARLQHRNHDATELIPSKP